MEGGCGGEGKIVSGKWTETFEWELTVSGVRSCVFGNLVGWVTGWWMVAIVVCVLGEIEGVLWGCLVAQGLVGRIGEMREPESSLGGRGPQVTRLVVGVEVDGFGRSLWEWSGDVGWLGGMLNCDVGFMGPFLAVRVVGVDILALWRGCCKWGVFEDECVLLLICVLIAECSCGCLDVEKCCCNSSLSEMRGPRSSEMFGRFLCFGSGG